MKSTELIGKLAIRNAPTKLIGDCTFTDEVALIVDATEHHTVVQFTGIKQRIFGDDKMILSFDYCDNNWIEVNKDWL